MNETAIYFLSAIGCGLFLFWIDWICRKTPINPPSLPASDPAPASLYGPVPAPILSRSSLRSYSLAALREVDAPIPRRPVRLVSAPAREPVIDLEFIDGKGERYEPPIINRQEGGIYGLESIG